MTDDNPSADYEFFAGWRESPLLTPRMAGGVAAVLRVYPPRTWFDVTTEPAS